MKRFFSSRLFSALYAAVLLCFTAYVLLDAFIIPRSYAAEDNSGGNTSATETQSGGADVTETPSGETDASGNTSASSAPVTTGTSYSDGNITITLSTAREYDTTIYTADIVLRSTEYLQTALAGATYGRNITAATSDIAGENDAIIAVNGDYYGGRTGGYVIRDGVLYRSASAGDDQQDLVIYADGSFEIVNEGDISAETLLENGAQQVFSFGPGLINGGEITVGTSTEVDRAKTSNPRTAIGEIAPLHYVLVVADGRTSESTGLSLYELAEYMQSLGVTTAYNLDGGGSSTLYFNGQVVNNPTTDGRTIKERKVSDIVYIGY